MLRNGTAKDGFLSKSKLVSLTGCFAGVQFGWALQIAFVTPIFRLLGLSAFWVGFVWLAGPISGLVMQPLAGVLSDSATFKIGRRRPFIIVGTLCILIGMALISNAESMGYLFSDSSDSHPVAIAICVVAFWIFDLANNTVQGPCRALLVDCAHAEQQKTGNSLFSIMLGVGNLLGFLIGGLDIVHTFGFFGIAAVFLVLCVSNTVLRVKEKQHILPIGHVTTNPFKEIISNFHGLPKEMWRICCMQLLAWVAWFVFFIYATDWVGVNIFKGDPDAEDDSDDKDKYEEGVRWGALSLCGFSIVTLLYSPVIPRIISHFGSKTVYAIGQSVIAAVLLSTPMVSSKYVSMALFSVLGITWATTMVVPFTIVGKLAGPVKSGAWMGVFNIFVVLPQLFVSLTVGQVIRMANNDVTAGLFIGGIFAVFSLFYIPLIIDKPPGEDTDPLVLKVASL